MVLERPNMLTRQDILKQHLDNPPFRQICNVLSDYDLQYFTSLYLIICYIVNKSNNDITRNLFNDISSQSPSVNIKYKLYPYLQASDLNIKALINCTKNIKRTTTRYDLIEGLNYLLDILESFEQSKLPPNNNQQLWI